jgi:hypothetical protein
MNSSQEQRLSPNAELTAAREIFAEGWRRTKAIFALKGMEIPHTISFQVDGARQNQETRTKPEIDALLSHYTLTETGALAGDDLLVELAGAKRDLTTLGANVACRRCR